MGGHRHDVAGVKLGADDGMQRMLATRGHQHGVAVADDAASAEQVGTGFTCDRQSAARLIVEGAGRARPRQNHVQSATESRRQKAVLQFRGGVHAGIGRFRANGGGAGRRLAPHETAASPAALDKPEALDFAIGAGDGGQIDSQRLGQCALWRQARSFGQSPALDIAGQRLRNGEIFGAGDLIERGGPALHGVLHGAVCIQSVCALALLSIAMLREQLLPRQR